MKILHVLDHSLPLHSGYTFRTVSILKAQRALGWETFHLTSPKQENCTVDEEDADGWHFYRTPAPLAGFHAARAAREAAGRRHGAPPDGAGAATASRHPPRAFAGARCPAGAACRTPARHPRCLRSPCLLGGRRGRPRDAQGVGHSLPAYPGAGDLRTEARGPRHDDLRRPPQGHRGARHPRCWRHRHPECRRHRQVSARRTGGSCAPGASRPDGCHDHRLHRIVLRL